MIKRGPLLFFFALSLMLSAAELPFYIGTYTRGDSEGIYKASIDLETGTLSGGELAARAQDPSWITLSSDGKHLYAANETKDGGVSAFAVNKNGRLTLLNERPSGGAHPCHLDLSPDGKTLVVANYSGGNVSSYPVKDDGSLGTQASLIQHEGSGFHRRQSAPHAHEALFAGDRLYVADLGLDQVLVYGLEGSKLGPREAAYATFPGTGPRHVAVDDRSSTVYVLNEISSSITRFSSAGKQETVSTLPARWTGGGNSTAEINLHPNGKFLYASNRGHDSIAVFAIRADHTLKPVQHQAIGGKTPRNFELTPDGRFLVVAGQNSGTLSCFRVDPRSGRLKPSGSSLAVPAPVCIAWAASEK